MHTLNWTFRACGSFKPKLESHIGFTGLIKLNWAIQGLKIQVENENVKIHWLWCSMWDFRVILSSFYQKSFGFQHFHIDKTLFLFMPTFLQFGLRSKISKLCQTVQNIYFRASLVHFLATVFFLTVEHFLGGIFASFFSNFRLNLIVFYAM